MTYCCCRRARPACLRPWRTYKGHPFVTWWIFGTVLFLVALPIAVTMKPERGRAAPVPGLPVLDPAPGGRARSARATCPPLRPRRRSVAPAVGRPLGLGRICPDLVVAGQAALLELPRPGSAILARPAEAAVRRRLPGRRRARWSHTSGCTPQVCVSCCRRCQAQRLVLVELVPAPRKSRVREPAGAAVGHARRQSCASRPSLFPGRPGRRTGAACSPSSRARAARRARSASTRRRRTPRPTTPAVWSSSMSHSARKRTSSDVCVPGRVRPLGGAGSSAASAALTSSSCAASRSAHSCTNAWCTVGASARSTMVP